MYSIADHDCTVYYLLTMHGTQINCVVMGGVNTDDLSAFVELTQHQQLDVRFIEWMPFDDNRWNGDKFVG